MCCGDGSNRCCTSSISIRSGPDPTTCKVVLLGAVNTGKTSLAERYIKDTFNIDQTPTIGAAFFNKCVTLPDGSAHTVQLWDTAGQEKYRSLSPIYYRAASIVIITYSIVDPKSLISAKEWISDVMETFSDEDKPFFLIVGTKSDLVDDDIIETGEIINATAAIQEINDIVGGKAIVKGIIETSSKTSKGMMRFHDILCELLQTRRTKIIESTPKPQIYGADVIRCD